MKKLQSKLYLTCFFIISSLFFISNTNAMLVEEINPDDYVVDYTLTLGKDQRDELSKILGDLEKQTGYQVGVVMINSLEGDYIEHYAVKLFEKLKIGSQEKDEGVLFLISKNDRQMRIEVGYGLEPLLTDGVAKDILDNYVRPEFKNENYYEGIKVGVEKINQVLISGDNSAFESSQQKSSNFNWLSILIFIFVFGLNILGWLFAIIARTKSWWLGGVVTFVMGFPILYFGFGLNVVGDLVLFVFTLTGFLFDYFISKNYKYWQQKLPLTPGGKGANGPAWWAGGTWGPGSGGFSGSSGSGFGGFGGGSSGGGGSSSSW